MSRASLVLFALLSFSLAAGAKNKSYTVKLDQPARFGTVQLQPGKYKLQLEGGQAVLTSDKSHQSVSTHATVEQASRKFQYTGVELNKSGSIDRLEGVQLAGTHMDVRFN